MSNRGVHVGRNEKTNKKKNKIIDKYKQTFYNNFGELLWNV